MNDLLEILEQIRKAEEKNEQQMQVLRTEMQQLTKKKEDEIHVIEERKRQELVYSGSGLLNLDFPEQRTSFYD